MDRSFIVLAVGGLLNVTALLSSFLMGLSICMDTFNIFLYLNTAAFAVIKQLQCCSSTLDLFALLTTVQTLNETIVPTLTSDIMHCVPLSATQQKCLHLQLPGHSVNFVARLADVPLMD